MTIAEHTQRHAPPSFKELRDCSGKASEGRVSSTFEQMRYS